MKPLARKSDQRGTSSRKGSVDKDTEPRFLVIGQIGKPHGVRGDVRVFPHTDMPERFTWLEAVYIGEENPQAMLVDYARCHKHWVLLKLKGFDSRLAVEGLRGQLLQVKEDQAIPLEEDEYFLFELIGLAVISEDGMLLGELIQVIETGANNVFVVDGPKGEILIPDTPEVILAIDFSKREILVHLLPGLLPT